MIYFNSRYLSEKLNVNLAKWKRWAREFLPPDPLGGLQSGYARQFNLKEAFRVYLGGQLLSVLRFTIPETRMILNDLDSMLKELGVYTLYPKQHPTQTKKRWLTIYNMANGCFDYAIHERTTSSANSKARFGRMLNLSSIYNDFLKSVVD